MTMIDRRRLIASAAAATSVAALPFGRLGAARAATSGNAARFPKGFLWGASTAAHQIEGNNINADLWLIENLPNSAFPDRSGDAVNSFELWPVDLDLVRNMGLNAYRFSLEWARIEPEKGQFSQAMLDHYKAMIDGCRTRGIHPVVTFNHFTTPRWFAAQGGWQNAESPALFARYCDRAARHLAAGIGHATTLNEPNSVQTLDGAVPPQLVAKDREMQETIARQMGVSAFSPGFLLYIRDRAAYTANMMAAHKQGVAAIKAVRSDLPVGVSIAMRDEQALDASGIAKRDEMRERFYGGWLRLAAETCDFVGVQNYERKVWSAQGPVPVKPGVPVNVDGAEIWPGSLANCVKYAWEVTRRPIFVTEHGVATDDDRLRVALIPAALKDLQAVTADGVPVLGYMHWSLMDNFEWAFGYRYRYGLHAVDRTSFRRTPKPSAAVLGRIARANAL